MKRNGFKERNVLLRKKLPEIFEGELKELKELGGVRRQMFIPQMSLNSPGRRPITPLNSLKVEGRLHLGNENKS